MLLQRFSLFALFSFLSCLIVCMQISSTQGQASHDETDEKLADAIANKVLDFALRVGRQLSGSGSTSLTKDFKSEVFSPLSLTSALVLLMLGAKGSSYQQLQALIGDDMVALQQASRFHSVYGQLLEEVQHDVGRSNARKLPHWQSTVAPFEFSTSAQNAPPKDPQTITVANGIFTQTGASLNPDYQKAVATVYNSNLSQHDFAKNASAALDYINDWITHKTSGKIAQALDLNQIRNAQMVLVSTLYFRGFWETSFFAELTRAEEFFPDGPHKPAINVPMMFNGGTFPHYDSFEHNCSIIGLPYVGNTTTMYILRPFDSTRTRLQQLQQYLDANIFEDLVSKMFKKTVVLALPKMRLRKDYPMRETLQRLGLRDIFLPQQSDLSLINLPGSLDAQTPEQALERLERARWQRSSKSPDDAEPLFVRDIVHNVDLDINEYGTEAAAATFVVLKKSSQVLFRVTDPFIFLIRHEPTGMVLFYGVVNEPEL